MCGIVLAWSWGRTPITPGALLGGVAAQAHRGPDGHGYALWRRDQPAPELWRGGVDRPARLSEAPFRLGLGHNWLAVQDRDEQAGQPMATPDGRYWVTFNGELYDAAEHRRALAASGRRFVTSSDTEVLLALWQEHGPEAVTRMRGMFAFALYDSRDDVVWLGRDRFGIKPLCYATLPDGAGIVAASELRGLHGTGLVPRRLDTTAAMAFLAAAVTKPGETTTLFAGVHELAPGCLMRLRPGSVSTRRYYRLPPLEPVLGPDAIADVRHELTETVRLHLVSCRDVGILLSGGLDSTTVARAIAEPSEPGNRPVAFTYGRETTPDVELAGLTARHLGMDLERVRPPAEVPMDALVDLAVALESPLHTWGSLNEYLLLDHIRARGVSVLLSGQGGDEVLSGYPWFLPLIESHVAATSGVTAARELSQRWRARTILPPAIFDTTTRIYRSRREWVRCLSAGALETLRVGEDEVLSWEPVRYYLNDELSWNDFRDRQIFRRDLPHLLRQEDRLGMWFSIETRVPFLDHRLVELLGRLRPEVVVGDGWLKHPLRILFPDQPEAVRLQSGKHGFWENASAFPPTFGLFLHLAMRRSAWMRGVADAAEVARLEPMVQWRFFQVALLSEVGTAAKAGEWLADLSEEAGVITSRTGEQGRRTA